MAREWWGAPGVVGDVVHAVVAGSFGRIAYVVPLVLLAFGVRMMRAPQDSEATNRILIGTLTLTAAACGITHLAAGLPTPPQGPTAMRGAGGIVGFLASSPLASAVTGVGALVILLIVGFFGLLLLTATPVNQIPARVEQLTRAPAARPSAQGRRRHRRGTRHRTRDPRPAARPAGWADRTPQRGRSL